MARNVRPQRTQSMGYTYRKVAQGGGSFSAEVGDWVLQTTGNIEQFTKSLLVKLFSEVVMRTPVKTGRARSNWQLGINTPILTSLVTDVDNGPVTTDGSGNSTTKDRINAQVMASNIMNVNTYFLTNNVYYVRLLEYGHSQRQAPSGMVRISVQNFQRMMQEAKAEAGIA